MQGGGKVKTSLVMNLYNYRRPDAPLDRDRADLDQAWGGSALEMADATEFKDFAAFQKLIAEAFQEFPDRWQVFALLSPPRLPRYNGAVEAGNGSVKTRVRQEAARHGRIGCWTSDDLEAARLQANLTARPWGEWCPGQLLVNGRGAL